MHNPPDPLLLTSGEVAALFRVDPKTVARWAKAGLITSIRTPGGHRRYRETEVRALLDGEAPADDDEPETDRNTDPYAIGSRNPMRFDR